MLDDLTSALAELDLQPGESRTVQVNDYEIEIRRPEGEPSEFADMVMLEPWTEFPRPTGRWVERDPRSLSRSLTVPVK